MTSCPKCSSTRISGPTYRRLGWGGEALIYRCGRCGYQEQRPTRDAIGPNFDAPKLEPNLTPSNVFEKE